MGGGAALSLVLWLVIGALALLALAGAVVGFLWLLQFVLGAEERG